jgi:hypothetical protein
MTSVKKHYVAHLRSHGFPVQIAKGIVDGAVQEARRQSRTAMDFRVLKAFNPQSLRNTPFGDVYKKVKREGATDFEISEWWRRSDAERSVLVQVLNTINYAAFLKVRETTGQQGTSTMDYLKMRMPFFAEAGDDAHPNFTGKNSKLPYELFPRIYQWIVRNRGNPYGIDGIPGSPFNQSVNSVIRSKIAKGKLPAATRSTYVRLFGSAN